MKYVDNILIVNYEIFQENSKILFLKRVLIASCSCQEIKVQTIHPSKQIEILIWSRPRGNPIEIPRDDNKRRVPSSSDRMMEPKKKHRFESPYNQKNDRKIPYKGDQRGKVFLL